MSLIYALAVVVVLLFERGGRQSDKERQAEEENFSWEISRVLLPKMRQTHNERERGGEWNNDTFPLY